VARADIVSGSALRLPAGQASGIALRSGDAVFEGDTLDTAGGGHVYLSTADKAFISVRPGSRLTIDRYRVSDAGGANASATEVRFTLHRGVARLVSGNAVSAAKDRFRLNTPLAAIGVRGTDFTVFADAQVTRASVLSGRISVSPFTADCLPSGLGPCGGAAALELGAGELPVIELRRGDQAPRLIQSQELRPDRVSPPAPQEAPAAPASQSGASAAPRASGGTSPGPVADVGVTSLAEVKADDRVIDPKNLPAPTVFWGRWQAYAGLPAQEALNLFQDGRFAGGMLTPYGVAVDAASARPLPVSGRVGFVLRDAEAWRVNVSTGATQALSVASPELIIDFGKARYSTRLYLQGSEGTVQFRSQGGLAANGWLLNDSAEAGTLLRGVVVGDSSVQAAYAFRQQLPQPGEQVIGATRWAR